MISPELHMFTALAADLTKREARARASLPSSEQVLGLGRFVLELGPHVGVFARGTSDRSSGHPNGLVIDFVNRNPINGHANTVGKTTYRPHEGLVTVTDSDAGLLSVNGLILALDGVFISRRLPVSPNRPFRVADDELDYIADFIYGDPDHPTAMHSSHIVRQPGRPVEGLEIVPIAGI